ncbi:LIM and cysteine-rich domains protein 1 [Danio rerio]|uniref:LIM and cysteine-rich domains 1 n=1 Tax=Danio rerio TaxID=7955 RepID=E7FCK0_DANRE|nr:LIM and cysteine-rich domains protein 1 [Danio rerio]|eukprot:NP_957364.2 LIM and cysteine-rich domains protein 1 [Danio rerio]
MSKGPLPAGKGAACLTCKGICPGFQPHSWRKACVKCQCSQDEHAFISNNEDDLKVGRLLADSRYTHLTAKVKGGDGTRVYKRNRMIVTNPVVSRKDPTFNTVTYDWAPTGLTQKLAMLYMSLLPEERRPVAGTEGSLYRHKQLTRQLPAYDHDPAYCHSLSEAELKVMAQFVKSYKEESLGVGEVALPGEKSTTKRNEKISQEQPDPPLTEQTPDGAIESPVSNETEYYCSGCGQLAAMDEPVVYADRAGYERLWHPACFVCGECGEALVDLIYFWKEGALLCGRHYCQSIRPRCLGCDELIFSDMLLQEASGHVWHKEHFCCWLCGQDIRVECGCDKRQTT